MKKRITILLLFFITAISTNAQWVSKKDTLQLPGWGVADCIDALSPDTVILSVNPPESNKFSAIYITGNNGLNWSEIPLPDFQWGESVIDISIYDNSAIWIATAYPAKICKTLDKGVNWEEQFFDITKTDFMNYIEMFDENNGIAMGDAVDDQPALFIYTNDGGNNWNINTNNLNGYISAATWSRLDFVDVNNGYFSWGNDNLLKTTDGGLNWAKTNCTGAVKVLKFYNQNLGLTFSTKYSTSFFSRTTDGGDTWEEYQFDMDDWIWEIEFLPGKPSYVWCTGQYGLYYSMDSGKTWQEYNLGIDTLRGRDIVFTDENHGWLLCDNGNIYYTDNNGGIVTGIEEFL